MANQHTLNVRIRKNPAYRASLTIAVSLLTTTLASADANRYTNQEVLISDKPSIGTGPLTIVNNLLQTTLKPVEAPPFYQNKWPNPAPKRLIARSWIQTRPIFAVDRSNPGRISNIIPPLKRVIANTWVQTGIEEIPKTPVGRQTYVNPLLRDYIVPTISSKFDEDGTPPGIPKTWNNPLAKRKINPDWVRPGLSLTVTPPSIPSGKTSNFNPLIKGKIRPSWTQSRPIHAVDRINPGKVSSIIPPAKRLIARGWIYDSLALTVTPPDLPKGKTSNFNPILKAKVNPSWTVSRPQFYQDSIAFRQTEWPNPAPKRKLAHTWINAKILEPVIPSGKQIYSNPLIAKKVRPGWINPKAEEVVAVANPFKPVLFQNPRVIKPVIAWHDYFIIDDNQPTQSDPTINIHTFSKKQRTHSWVYRSLPIPVNPPVVGVVSNVNPELRKQQPITFIDRPLPLITAVAPVFPNGKQFYTNPILAIGQAKTWIQRFQLQLADSQILKQNNWPNPIVGRSNRPQGIQTFRIGIPLVGDPFRQTGWPNPLVGAAGEGWIQARPFFYTEDKPRLSFNLFPNPLHKARPTATWIQELLPEVPPVIIKPFNQNDWPVFLKIRRNGTSWVITRAIILPPQKGREICLDADAVEYDLPAAIEIYELSADATEYDLEADGSDCL